MYPFLHLGTSQAFTFGNRFDWFGGLSYCYPFFKEHVKWLVNVKIACAYFHFFQKPGFNLRSPPGPIFPEM
jgi:hypothetical protein